MKRKIILLAMIAAFVVCTSHATEGATESNPVRKIKDCEIRYKTVKIDGLNIFYREAGEKNKPVILLLHGFPSSSHMYRHLIEDLADSYYLIAPDYPGFGQSSAPSTDDYEYTFDNLARTISHFIDALGLTKFSLYVQDYGGPVGFRIASQRPQSIQALIVQNANAYTEGLGDAIAPMASYFNNPNQETEKGARWILSLESTKWQYTQGTEDISKVSPDSYSIDQMYLDRPGNDAIQLALFRDYKSNLQLYETWQTYFRKYQPATIVISGKNDPIFTAPGAEAFKRDIPDAQISLLNGGHFVLEEHHLTAARLIKDFLRKNHVK